MTEQKCETCEIIGDNNGLKWTEESFNKRLKEVERLYHEKPDNFNVCKSCICFFHPHLHSRLNLIDQEKEEVK